MTDYYEKDMLIGSTRAKLEHVTLQIEAERQRFASETALLEKKQRTITNRLTKLHKIRIGVPRIYLQTLNEVSKGTKNTSQYVLKQQAELCCAFHSIEIKRNQLKLLVKHQLTLEESLQESLNREVAISEEVEERLLKFIKYVSRDLADVICHKKSILHEQHCSINTLKDEIGETEESSEEDEVCELPDMTRKGSNFMEKVRMSLAITPFSGWGTGSRPAWDTGDSSRSLTTTGDSSRSLGSNRLSLISSTGSSNRSLWNNNNSNRSLWNNNNSDRSLNASGDLSVGAKKVQFSQ